MLQGKSLDSNEEVIAETEAYFKAKDKSFYKKGIEMLEKRLNECITLEGDYVDEWSRILPKSCFFISHPTNLLSDVLCQAKIEYNKLIIELFDEHTAAKERAATENPNRNAVESVVCAHLGSQVAQAASKIIPVQIVSIKIAWVTEIPGWITVTHNDAVEFSKPSSNRTYGVTIYTEFICDCQLKITILLLI